MCVEITQDSPNRRNGLRVSFFGREGDSRVELEKTGQSIQVRSPNATFHRRAESRERDFRERVREIRDLQIIMIVIMPGWFKLHSEVCILQYTK